MINHNDHIDRRALLIAERDALIAANETQKTWGAAIGVRAERIAGINRSLPGSESKAPKE